MKAAAASACCYLQSQMLRVQLRCHPVELVWLLLLALPQLWHVNRLFQHGLWNSLHGAVSVLQTV